MCYRILPNSCLISVEVNFIAGNLTRPAEQVPQVWLIMNVVLAKGETFEEINEEPKKNLFSKYLISLSRKAYKKRDFQNFQRSEVGDLPVWDHCSALYYVKNTEHTKFIIFRNTQEFIHILYSTFSHNFTTLTQLGMPSEEWVSCTQISVQMVETFSIYVTVSPPPLYLCLGSHLTCKSFLFIIIFF